MKKFGWRKRIGCISPAVLELVCFDFYRFAPEGVGLVGVTDKTNTWSAEDIELTLQSALSSAAYLGDRGVDFVVHMGAAHVASKGPGYDAGFIAELQARSGVGATTSIRSAIQAFQHLGAHRIAIVSPWPEKITGWVARCVEAERIEVVRTGCADVDFKNLHTVEPDYLVQFAASVAAAAPQAQAIYIPGPQAPAAMCVDAIERKTGKPVVASTPADFWAAFRALGLRERIEGHGILLRSLSEGP